MTCEGTKRSLRRLILASGSKEDQVGLIAIPPPGLSVSDRNAEIRIAKSRVQIEEENAGDVRRSVTFCLLQFFICDPYLQLVMRMQKACAR